MTIQVTIQAARRKEALRGSTHLRALVLEAEQVVALVKPFGEALIPPPPHLRALVLEVEQVVGVGEAAARGAAPQHPSVGRAAAAAALHKRRRLVPLEPAPAAKRMHGDLSPLEVKPNGRETQQVHQLRGEIQ